MPLYLELARALARRRALFIVAVLSLPLTFGVLSFLIVKIVPTYAQVFDSFGKDLPPLTRLVVGFSRNYERMLLMAFGLAWAAALAFYLLTRSSAARAFLDALLLKLPLLGPITRDLGLAHFSLTLSGLLKTGMPGPLALDRAANMAAGPLIGRAKSALQAGKGLKESLATAGLDSLGAEGEPGALLLGASQAYARRAQAATHLPSILFLLGMTLLLGIAVGTVVIAMFMPMFDLGNAVTQP